MLEAQRVQGRGDFLVRGRFCGDRGWGFWVAPGEWLPAAFASVTGFGCTPAVWVSFGSADGFCDGLSSGGG